MLNENTTVAESVRSEPDELMDDVLEVLLSWHTHVIHAESRAGLHAFLCTASPRYLSMIVHLRQRHRELFQRIEHLRRRVFIGNTELLALELEALRREIDVHDELETELLADALENP